MSSSNEMSSSDIVESSSAVRTFSIVKRKHVNALRVYSGMKVILSLAVITVAIALMFSQTAAAAEANYTYQLTYALYNCANCNCTAFDTAWTGSPEPFNGKCEGLGERVSSSLLVNRTGAGYSFFSYEYPNNVCADAPFLSLQFVYDRQFTTKQCFQSPQVQYVQYGQQQLPFSMDQVLVIDPSVVVQPTTVVTTD